MAEDNSMLRDVLTKVFPNGFICAMLFDDDDPLAKKTFDIRRRLDPCMCGHSNSSHTLLSGCAECIAERKLNIKQARFYCSIWTDAFYDSSVDVL